MLIKKGERFNLSQNNLLDFTINIEWNCHNNYTIDSNIFLLNGKLTNDENIIFVDNPIGMNESVILDDNDTSKEIKFNLDNLAGDIDKIILTLSIEEYQNFGQISDLNMTLNGDNTLQYKLDDFTNETAITLCEIYLKNNEWRLKAVGTGFVSGLASICNAYAIEIDS